MQLKLETGKNKIHSIMSSQQKLNCSFCMKDIHSKCLDEEKCLCADNNHGVKIFTLKDGVRVEIESNEPTIVEQALHDDSRLWDIRCNDMGGNTPPFVLHEYVKLLIISEHMVSKFDLIVELKPWCLKHGISYDDIDLAIETIFSDIEMMPYIKLISNTLGRKQISTSFDTTQIIEVGEWIKGKYHIKRIDLTGTMLFFNGKYYENETTAIIQRTIRECMVKAKNKDVIEVVKYVEQSCGIIKWRDIENSIHLKCLNNGTYDISGGVFTPSFNPDNIILNQIPHDYDDNATYEKIDATVKTIIPDNYQRQSYYDFISTCFYPYQGVDYQFCAVGGTGTGKSQLGVLAELSVGEDNVGDATIHLIAKDSTTQKNMAFKMLNIDYDLSSDSIQQIEVLKKWITQDKFTARGIYEQATTFKPMSRIMSMANDLYEIPNEDDAEAVYDRTYLIRVERKFRHQDGEIKNVMKKVATKEQLNGFVTYLLRNANWIAVNEKYHHPMSVVDVESIWNAFGNRIRTFIKKHTIPSTTVRVQSGEPFNDWMNYCHINNFKPKDKKRFTKIFDEIIGNSPTKTRVGGDEMYAYTGFRMKTPEEIIEDEKGLIGF